MTIDLVFSPELRLSDGTVIKDRNAAIQYVHNYRMRSPDAGSAQVLHLLENATTPEELERAAQRFRSWIGHLDRDR
jgi:hypothetical protein